MHESPLRKGVRLAFLEMGLASGIIEVRGDGIIFIRILLVMS